MMSSRTDLSGAFGLVVRFRLKPGAAEEFDRLMAATVPQIQANEPETITYIVHTVEGEPDVRIFYELYASPAAFDDHEAQDYIQDFLAERAKYVESFTVDRLGVVTAAGTPAGG